jgi:FixJ family two-component response regulator
MAAHIPGTIVVIDDDPLVRRAIVRLLRLAPCTVETFASAEAFLGRPRREAPACLILDVDLPGLSGPALQRTLAVAQRSIPIIFLTGRGTLPMAADALPSGAVACLTKPFDAQELFDALRQAITWQGRAAP